MLLEKTYIFQMVPVQIKTENKKVTKKKDYLTLLIQLWCDFLPMNTIISSTPVTNWFKNEPFCCFLSKTFKLNLLQELGYSLTVTKS